MSGNNKPLWGAANNNLILLFALNAFVFIIINFLRLAYAVSYDTNEIAEQHFTNEILHWFVLHAKPGLLLIKPWTIMVSSFSHYSVYTLIGNMIWLWMFGYILQDLAGNKILLPVYLYSGIASAVAFLLATNFLPFIKINIGYNYFYIGAGACVLAIAVAATTLVPHYKVFNFINGGIPIWIITLIYVLIDFAGMYQYGTAYSFAHLAGAVIGFLYIKQLNKGNDWGNWMYMLGNKIANLFTPLKTTKKNYQFKIYKNENNFVQQNNQQEKIDKILDKINEQGFDKLTKEEKDFLQSINQ